ERRWRACIHDALARPVATAGVVVVDLETTGGAPGGSGITQIGAVRAPGGRPGATLVTVGHPARRIPPLARHPTGITDEMVADAPSLAEALPRFLEFAGDAVLVAHNAAFDVAHLDAAGRMLLGRPLDRPALCTLRLARRLLPELRRRSLDSVAATLG